MELAACLQVGIGVSGDDCNDIGVCARITDLMKDGKTYFVTATNCDGPAGRARRSGPGGRLWNVQRWHSGADEDILKLRVLTVNAPTACVANSRDLKTC